jgi:hypothetical protein
MYPIRRLIAAFALASENHFRKDNPSQMRVAYNAFRKLGVALDRLTLLSPPKKENWQTLKEGVKAYDDWHDYRVLEDAMRQAGMPLREQTDLKSIPGDVVMYTFTAEILAREAVKSEADFRAVASGFPVREPIDYMIEHIDQLERASDVIIRMNDDDITKYRAHEIAVHQALGATKLSPA